MQSTTIQIRSTMACQRRRKSRPRFCSRRSIFGATGDIATGVGAGNGETEWSGVFVTAVRAKELYIATSKSKRRAAIKKDFLRRSQYRLVSLENFRRLV